MRAIAWARAVMANRAKFAMRLAGIGLRVRCGRDRARTAARRSNPSKRPLLLWSVGERRNCSRTETRSPSGMSSNPSSCVRCSGVVACASRRHMRTLARSRACPMWRSKTEAPGSMTLRATRKAVERSKRMLGRSRPSQARVYNQRIKWKWPG